MVSFIIGTALLAIVVLLYACVRVGADADRRMREMWK